MKGWAARGTRVAGPWHRGLVAAAAAAASAAGPAASAAKSSRAFATAAAAADARLAQPEPPGVKGRSAPAGGRAGGRGWGGASPGGLGRETDCQADGGRRGGREAAGQGDSPRSPPRAPGRRAPAPPTPAHLQPTRSRLICITRRAPPRSRGQNGLYAATTWREGKGAKMEGEGRGACEEAGAGCRAAREEGWGGAYRFKPKQ